MKETQHSQEQDADLVGAALKRGGHTLAVAESLTGGLLASAFARASGASKWFRGGVVAYSSAVKYDLLDVPRGPVVSEPAALAMARGVGHLLEADVAVAVTGVGGPGLQDGEPPGTVWIATWPDQLGGAVLLRLSGSPEAICQQVCGETARILRERLVNGGTPSPGNADCEKSAGERGTESAGRGGRADRP
jgi:nicotinamide-nucleotide amidase